MKQKFHLNVEYSFLFFLNLSSIVQNHIIIFEAFMPYSNLRKLYSITMPHATSKVIHMESISVHVYKNYVEIEWIISYLWQLDLHTLPF